jgi:hypothetical protein
MTRSNGLEYFILPFYRGRMVICLLGIVYEYASILVILIDVILLISMKFAIKCY